MSKIEMRCKSRRGQDDSSGRAGQVPFRLQAGFTLIELLVVLVVLGILFSMLLPTLGRTKQIAGMAQCYNNLRQIGIGVGLYAEDHASYPLPITTNAQGTIIKNSFAIGGPHGTLGGTARVRIPRAEERPLFNYIKSPSVFRCPADRGIPFDGAPLAPTSFESAGCSYLYNVHAPRCFEAARSGRIQPDRLIMLSEPSAMGWPGTRARGALFVQWHYRNGKVGVYESDRARQKANFVSPIYFFDGHVGKVDFTENFRSNDPASAGEGPGWTWGYFPKP